MPFHALPGRHLTLSAFVPEFFFFFFPQNCLMVTFMLFLCLCILGFICLTELFPGVPPPHPTHTHTHTLSFSPLRSLPSCPTFCPLYRPHLFILYFLRYIIIDILLIWSHLECVCVSCQKSTFKAESAPKCVYTFKK